METLLLRRSDIEHLINATQLLHDIRRGFQAYSMERRIDAQRAHSPLPSPGATAMILFPGLVPGIPAYTVKVHAKFPQAAPAITGVIHLHDANDGRLLAILDSTLLTAVRTGLAGAVAADVLARPDASRVAIIGAGVQGEVQLRYLPLVRRITSVTVYDTVAERAVSFAKRMSAELGVEVVPVSSVAACTAEAEIIVTATWARTPFLFPDLIRPGTHITTLGPDQPGKCEVAAEVIRTALFACDDRDLAVSMGAIGGARLGPQAIDAELGEIIAGAEAGRSDQSQVSVYGGVGLAFQDLCAAWQVYQAALASGAGTRISFLN